MRARHLVGLALAAVACGRGAEQGGEGRATVVQSGETAARPLTATELKQFAPLPSVMNGSPVERTPALIALGRRLYHETVLSNGHDVSCNSCHALNGYGADGRPSSFGSLGHAGGRNAPTVYNAAGHVAQFWDGRAPTVEVQAVGPILNPAEMAMPDSHAVLAHMRGSPAYRAEFRAAFPAQREPITYTNVGRAIGAFERGLVTPARWDRYLEGDGSALSAEEQRGLATFVHAGCASCHGGTYVGGGSFRRLGTAKSWPASTDSGRFAVTKIPADLFVFKVASLRNVEKTAPYFHDGSVTSLDDAIRLMGRHQLGVELGEAQVRDIRAWLSALTGELPAAYIAQPPNPLAQR
jgi:cytochrome c peroxidase